MELKLSIDELRCLDQYPGTAYNQKAHIGLATQKNVKHRDYHRHYTITSIILMFFIFSLIGWIWEVGIHVIEDGKFINRGTLHGPWLPIYGTGGIMGILVLRKFIDKHVLTFTLTVLLFSCVEYATSWYLETVKHIQYWNYSGYFLNIDGRVCLEGAMIFGFAGCAGIYIISPFLDDIINKISHKKQIIISTVLLVLLALDLFYSFSHPNVGEGITDYVFTYLVRFSLI